MDLDLSTKWYRFRQNNSGGSYDVSSAIDECVFIEAASSAAANERALELGLYFDGVDSGQDCECCGDRWHPAYEGDASGNTLEFLLQCLPQKSNSWDWEHGDVRYHRLVGPIYAQPQALIASYNLGAPIDLRRDLLTILGRYTIRLAQTQFSLTDILGQEANIRAHQADLMAKARQARHRQILDMEDEA